MKTRVFVSFDYDNDSDLKNFLIGQSRNENSPFEIFDLSIKEAIASNWKENARRRIKSADCVMVICGNYTHLATGVSAELKITQDEKVPYFMIWGRKNSNCTKPKAALPTDKIYKWSWENLVELLNGAR